jgi:hypothetical protein
VSDADMERVDNNVQAMRDQGIRDACEGRAARFRLSDGLLLRGILIIPTDSPDYREGFAYARAYLANAKEQP